MLKKMMLGSGALLVAAGFAFAGQADKATSGSWSGVVTDNICGAKNAGPAGASCTKQCVSKKGAKLALYDSDSKMKATGHEGHNVMVKGTLDKDAKTIHVTSLTMSKSDGM
jgi:hypothetical protein